MSDIKRESSTDTLSAINTNGAMPTDQYRLLNCQINVNCDPVVFKVEKMPVAAPEYILDERPVNHDDMYFLRWVLRGLFDRLTSEIETHHRGYRILRAESEPGISWDDFRTDKRGLLIWLVKDKSSVIGKGGNVASTLALLGEVNTELSGLMQKVQQMELVLQQQLAEYSPLQESAVAVKDEWSVVEDSEDRTSEDEGAVDDDLLLDSTESATDSAVSDVYV